jgi:hypothetical protein
MKSALFIVIVIISGALAGAIHGTVNFAIVEPYLVRRRIILNFGQTMKSIGSGKKVGRF